MKLSLCLSLSLSLSLSHSLRIRSVLIRGSVSPSPSPSLHCITAIPKFHIERGRSLGRSAVVRPPSPLRSPSQGRAISRTIPLSGSVCHRQQRLPLNVMMTRYELKWSPQTLSWGRGRFGTHSTGFAFRFERSLRTVWVGIHLFWADFCSI